MCILGGQEEEALKKKKTIAGRWIRFIVDILIFILSLGSFVDAFFSGVHKYLSTLKTTSFNFQPSIGIAMFLASETACGAS